MMNTKLILSVVFLLIGISCCTIALADDNAVELEEIKKAIVEKGLHWTADRTSISDLSTEEKRSLCGTMIPPEAKEKFDRLNRLPPPPLSKFGHQIRWDWREEGGVTPPKDQKNCESCWCFAACGALESMVKIYNAGTELDLSEQQGLSCNTHGGNCIDGGYEEWVYELFRDYGAIEESNMPYQASDTVTCTQINWQPIVDIQGWTPVPNNVSAIKNALEKGPITAVMEVYEDFFSYTGGCYTYATGSYIGLHTVLIIGWDDTLCGGQGGWIVKNSRGPQWGEDGFFKIRYGECGIGYGALLIHYFPLFNDRRAYGVGTLPLSHCCADLDGDGDVDIAVANFTSDCVSILRNAGNATFETKRDYDVWAPLSVFCSDLDGDTDVDLAVAGIGDVSILENKGDGTFWDTVNYWPSGSDICGGDLDADGDVDLAIVNKNHERIYILENYGFGVFPPDTEVVHYGTGGGPKSVICANLDGDGDLDLATANEIDNTISILKNNGDGTFAPAVNYQVGIIPQSVFGGDLDGDGDLDLAVAHPFSSSVSVLRNNGDGTFLPRVDYPAGQGPFSVFCADLDGDSDLDLALADHWWFSVFILKNNGDATFQSGVHYGTGEDSSPSSVSCADLDGDEDLDLVVTDNFDRVVILLNRGNNTEVEEPQNIDDYELPEDFSLFQNYPNPFNPTTNIEFLLPKSGQVKIEIFNILGQKVRTLVDQHLRAGHKIVDWDGKDDWSKEVSSGVYFYRIQAGDFTEAKKMLLLK